MAETQQAAAKDEALPEVLERHLEALQALLPPPRDTRPVAVGDVEKSLDHFQALAQWAAQHSLPRIAAPCRAAVRLLEDARRLGYAAADHRYVADVALPYLRREADRWRRTGQPPDRASERPVALIRSDDTVFQNFYDYISATQRIRLRMESFQHVRGYHYKDLYYIRKLLAQGQPVRRVLDIGCCGTVYPNLFDLDHVEYAGVDVSQISLDRMAAIYAGKPIRWIKDDATTLRAVEDDAFDLILATQVLEHLPDPETGLASMAAKLAPGGRLMIGTESALGGAVQGGRLRRVLAGVSLILGGYYFVHGMTPYVFPHRQVESYVDLEGTYRRVSVPHSHFHPLFFERVIREQHLAARVVFLRVSGLIHLYGIGAGVHFAAQEIKARLPILRYLGSQIFVAIEKPDKA